MDRRTFAQTLSALSLGLVGCGGDGRQIAGPAPITPPVTPPTTPPVTPTPTPSQPDYPTYADRAHGAAIGLARGAEHVSSGYRWPVIQSGGVTYPTDIFTGQSGVLIFLAAAYQAKADAEVRTALEEGGRWLMAQPLLPSQSLYEGNAGRAWAYLSLHEALGDAKWRDAAVALAPAIAAWRGGLPGDLINGTAGQGLFLLRLYERTKDASWLVAARAAADSMITTAVAIGAGIKFPSFAIAGGNAFYTGFAHGSAGAGFFLCRLAAMLSAADREPYIVIAERAATWLNSIAQTKGSGVNWYRREPDQMNVSQAQWCHGAPGIGHFYAELYRATKRDSYLTMATRCSMLNDDEGISHPASVQCHGVAGNAQLPLKLYRETGDATWLDRARQFEAVVWGRRLPNSATPAWISGDGEGVNQPGLSLGTAGIGWFYLDMASEGKLGCPITA